MSKLKKLARLADLEPHESADFFAQLFIKSRGSTRDGKPYFTCKFRDDCRTASVPVWADSPLFEDCQANWLPGRFYKIRGTFSEHEKYGPQIDIEQLRPVEERDREDGFDEIDFVEHSRFDLDALFGDLDALVAAEIKDAPL